MEVNRIGYHMHLVIPNKVQEICLELLKVCRRNRNRYRGLGSIVIFEAKYGLTEGVIGVSIGLAMTLRGEQWFKIGAIKRFLI